VSDDEKKEGQEKETGEGGADKAGLSAKDIAAMTKNAMSTAGPGASAGPALPAVGSAAPAFVKYTALLVHAVFLVCLLVLVWVLVTRQKGVSGNMAMSETIAYQREVSDGVILMSFRRYDQAEERFRIGATRISELSDRQEYSGYEFGHLRAAEGGALKLAESCRRLAETERTSTYIRGALAFKVQGKVSMDAGLKAMKEKDYGTAMKKFEAASGFYEQLLQEPGYKTSKRYEQAMMWAVKLAGIASREKAGAEPIFPARSEPKEGYDEPGASPGDATGKAAASTKAPE